jgi:hypothetical protein
LPVDENDHEKRKNELFNANYQTKCLLQAENVSTLDTKFQSERANSIRTLHSVREHHKQVVLFAAS